jgi:hypothetical protein
LTPLGRVVAGTVEIACTVLLEYVSGFAGGYFLGTLTDIPRLMFRPVDPAVRLALWKDFAGRTARMHAKSLRWARQWGGISAAFGGFTVAAREIRGGVTDEWTSIFGSMASGAWFARAGEFEN